MKVMIEIAQDELDELKERMSAKAPLFKQPNLPMSLMLAYRILDAAGMIEEKKADGQL